MPRLRDTHVVDKSHQWVLRLALTQSLVGSVNHFIVLVGREGVRCDLLQEFHDVITVVIIILVLLSNRLISRLLSVLNIDDTLQHLLLKLLSIVALTHSKGLVSAILSILAAAS